VKSLPTKLSWRSAPEMRRQVEEPVVVAARALPDQEAGAGDVVRIREPDQHAIPGAALPAQAVHAERPLTGAPLAVEESHLHRQPRVAAGVAAIDLLSDPVSAARTRLRRPLRRRSAEDDGEKKRRGDPERG